MCLRLYFIKEGTLRGSIKIKKWITGYYEYNCSEISILCALEIETFVSKTTQSLSAQHIGYKENLS